MSRFLTSVYSFLCNRLESMQWIGMKKNKRTWYRNRRGGNWAGAE
jgi:hypothetical protein